MIYIYESIYYRTCIFFFLNDPATTEIYTLSLPDALPIFDQLVLPVGIITSLNKGDVFNWGQIMTGALLGAAPPLIIYAFLIDRKSTRLNSSHDQISYAVFCLKKKKKQYAYSYLSGVIYLV